VVPAEQRSGRRGSTGNPGRMMHRLWLTVGLLSALVGAVLMALYAFPALQLAGDFTALAASFIPYGILAWAVAAVAFGLAGGRGPKLLALVAALAMVVQLVWARPYWPRSTEPASQTGSISVLTMNLRCDEPPVADLAKVVERERPDIVVLQDFSQDAWELLEESSWLQLLPWHSPQPKDQPQTNKRDPCGPLVFSDSPMTWEPATPKPGMVKVALPGVSIDVLPVSLPTPSADVDAWLRGFDSLDRALTWHGPVDGQSEALLVVGDFNATREHVPLRRLIADHQLVDAAEQSGAGWLPTFPTNQWYPPMIAIDHVLMTPALRATEVESFDIRWAGHRALLARLEPTI
jgi:endonuclease/exonuclease/phosphatase (EEP) superfamily protein YafD